MAKSPIAKRQKSRYLAVQGLYQWQIAGHSPSEILKFFKEENNTQKFDFDYLSETIIKICSNTESLDKAYEPLLDRPLDKLDPIELAILRLSTFELMHRLDIPYRVVINEALELAKTFGATDSYKFINGILDKLAPRLRYEEVKDQGRCH